MAPVPRCGARWADRPMRSPDSWDRWSHSGR